MGSSSPAPVLHIGPTNSDALVSWIIPSSPFVLQQKASLSDVGWAPSPDPGVINPNTLNNEATVRASNSFGLFRLSNP